MMLHPESPFALAGTLSLAGRLSGMPPEMQRGTFFAWLSSGQNSSELAGENQLTEKSVPVRHEIPPLLSRNIRESIAAVYGKNQVGAIYPQVMACIQEARQHRSIDLQRQDLERFADWYKDEIIYMIYADRFGVKPGEKNTTFIDLMDTLDYLKTLGVTTLYILPFMDSPMGDAGFDVRDFKSVRADLGGLSAFEQFAKAARQRGFKLKADLILNHISDQHAWFQAALAGDVEKIHYFVVSEREPQLTRYDHPAKGLMVDYHEPCGKISTRSLVFPDISTTHYREETIQGKKYYFYHTFYPFQMDINWENPEVLLEVLEIISFWSNRGIDIFRLDAAPYLIKTSGTTGENQPGTLAIIRLLSAYLQAIAPASVLQAEAAQKLDDLLPYFGKEERYSFASTTPGSALDAVSTALKGVPVSTNLLGEQKPQKKGMSRSDRVQIAYNFPYMSALWSSLITQDKSHFWNMAHTAPSLPQSATWATFLRVHDELTLQMVDPITRKIIADHLEPKGAAFRKGWGVSGRMASFLDDDPARIQLAFAMMLSQPGIPIIYYGDEIGERNNFEFAQAYANQREATQRVENPNLKIMTFYDSRDVNRGPLSLHAMQAAMHEPESDGGRLYRSIGRLIQIRKSHQSLTRGNLVELTSLEPAVFAYLRVFGDEKIAIINNLAPKTQETILTFPRAALAGLPTSGSLWNLNTAQADLAYQKLENSLTIQVAPYQSLWLNLDPRLAVATGT